MSMWMTLLEDIAAHEPRRLEELSTALTPLELHVEEELGRFSFPPWPFQPRAVLPLLEEASDLLERCLSYREQAWSIEERAVKALFDDQVFAVVDDIERRAAEVGADGLAERTQRELKEGLAKAAVEFADAVESGPSRLRAEMRAWAQRNATESETAAIAQQVEEALLPLKRERREAITGLHEALAWRRRQPGNADNFKERILSIRRHFYEDLKEAYLRVVCAAEGLRSVYVLYEWPLPPLKGHGIGYVDDLVYWVRRSYNYLDRLLQHEHELVLELSLTEVLDDGGPILSKERFDEGRKTGEFRFLIEQRHIPRGELARLRGLSVSFLLMTDARNVDRRFRGYAVLPEQKDSSDRAIERFAREYPLGDMGDVRLDGARAVPRSPLGYDADPVGEWRLHITKPQNDDLDFTDIVLKLRIAVLPPKSWQTNPFDPWVDPFKDTSPGPDVFKALPRLPPLE